MVELKLRITSADEEILKDSYKILRTIYQGHFSEVKLACHLLTDTHVALKVLPGDSTTISSEIDIMTSLEHPHIIKLYQIINTSEKTYLAMEYASRGRLLNWIQEDGHLREGEAHRVFQQIGSALHYCHSKGVIHGDLRPENILIDKKGNIKLSDFGLGTRVIPGQKLNSFTCILPFRAPELVQGKKYDGCAAEMWSLGVLLYLMMTGCLPFQAPTNAGIKQKILCAKYHIPSYLSANARDVIGQLLTLDPSQRATIDHIMHHPWVAKGKVPSLECSTEEFPSLPNPIIIIIMANLGYSPYKVLESLRAQNFNDVMGTYLILEQKILWDDSQENQVKHCITPCTTPADPSTFSLPVKRRASEPVLHPCSSPYPHQLPVDEYVMVEGSRRATMSAVPHCPLLNMSPICKTASKKSSADETESNTISQDTVLETNSLSREELQSPRPEASQEAERSQSSRNSSPSSMSSQQSQDVMTACTHRNRWNWRRVMRSVTNCVRKLCCCVPLQRSSRVSRNKVVPISREESVKTRGARRPGHKGANHLCMET